MLIVSGREFISCFLGHIFKIGIVRISLFMSLDILFRQGYSNQFMERFN